MQDLLSKVGERGSKHSYRLMEIQSQSKPSHISGRDENQGPRQGKAG